MLKLIKKQNDVLGIIRRSFLNGSSPTRQEIRLELSKRWNKTITRQAVDRHLFPLVKKKYIIIDKNLPRRNIKLKL